MTICWGPVTTERRHGLAHRRCHGPAEIDEDLVSRRLFNQCQEQGTPTITSHSITLTSSFLIRRFFFFKKKTKTCFSFLFFFLGFLLFLFEINFRMISGSKESTRSISLAGKSFTKLSACYLSHRWPRRWHEARRRANEVTEVNRNRNRNERKRIARRRRVKTAAAIRLNRKKGRGWVTNRNVS